MHINCWWCSRKQNGGCALLILSSGWCGCQWSVAVQPSFISLDNRFPTFSLPMITFTIYLCTFYSTFYPNYIFKTNYFSLSSFNQQNSLKVLMTPLFSSGFRMAITCSEVWGHVLLRHRDVHPTIKHRQPHHPVRPLPLHLGHQEHPFYGQVFCPVARYVRRATQVAGS